MRAVDVHCFAGGFALGVVQAGFELIAKREGSGGFGAPAMESNRHLLGDTWRLEAVEPRRWTPVNAEILVGNPPCSGFSSRSIHVAPKGVDRRSKPVSEWSNSFRGSSSGVNQCMHDLVEYAARCSGLQIVAFESVQHAGKLGLPLMRQLREKLELMTEEEWDLHHVFHNCLSVGGDCDRARYFWVASRVPFGILPSVARERPRNARETLADASRGIDGHAPPRTAEARRCASLLEAGAEWLPRETVSEAAGRFVERYGLDSLRRLDAWDSRRLAYFARRGFRRDPYQPIRWNPDKPCPVITGKIQEAVHPIEPRCLTFREAATVLGYPEDWKLSGYKTDSWLGKGIPVPSGRFIASSIKLSLEGRVDGLQRGAPTGVREWTHDNTRSWKR